MCGINEYVLTGGSSLSLTYIASERIIPGYFFSSYRVLYNLYVPIWYVKMIDS